MSHVVQRLVELRIIPLAVVSDPTEAVSIGAALKAGGLPTVEVAFRTPAALTALRAMAEDPDVMVGAGTIVSAEQVGRAVEAGAQYIVSPGFSAAVAAECRNLDVLLVPGVATATEMMTALDAGITLLKFFPASTSGGPAAIAALSAPFPTATFVPTGGIGPESALDYLRLPSVVAVGGSWLVTRQLLRDRDYEQITSLTAHARRLVSDEGAA